MLRDTHISHTRILISTTLSDRQTATHTHARESTHAPSSIPHLSRALASSGVRFPRRTPSPARRRTRRSPRPSRRSAMARARPRARDVGAPDRFGPPGPPGSALCGEPPTPARPPEQTAVPPARVPAGTHPGAARTRGQRVRFVGAARTRRQSPFSPRLCPRASGSPGGARARRSRHPPSGVYTRRAGK